MWLLSLHVCGVATVLNVLLISLQFGTLSVLIAVFTMACGATLFGFVYSTPVSELITGVYLQTVLLS